MGGKVRAVWRTLGSHLRDFWLSSMSRRYGRTFDRLLWHLDERLQDLAQERKLLPELIASLPAGSSEEVSEVLAGPGFKGWLFCEWLIEECQRLVDVDPARGEELAACAVVLAGRLDSGVYGEALIPCW